MLGWNQFESLAAPVVQLSPPVAGVHVMAERNSSSRRGVIVNRGVIQWGCSDWVLSTRLNQFAK